MLGRMSLTVVNLLMSNLVLDCERRELWDHENVKENNRAHRMRPGDDRRRSGHQRSPARSQKHPDEHQLRTKAARAARIGEGTYLGKKSEKSRKRTSETTARAKDPAATTGQSGKPPRRSFADNEIHSSSSFAYWHISNKRQR